MKIRFYKIYSANGVDGKNKASKVHSFGICKKGTTSTQYKPKVYLENALVPPLKLDDCFNYLGRHFDFKMTDYKHKSELIETITD